MYRLEVNAWERVQLIVVVGSQRGSVEFVARCLELRSILVPSAAEKAEIGFVDLPDGSARWRDGKYEFTLQFEEVQWHLLTRLVNEFEGWVVHEGVEPLVEKFPREE